MSKCEFCEINLKTDLDVSKHLASQSHKNKLDEFVALQPQDTIVQRNTPQNLAQVFEVLKIRSIADLRDLDEKNYFHIPQDETALLEVTDQLEKALFKCISLHETRNLPPKTRETVLEGLNSENVTLSQSKPQNKASTLSESRNKTSIPSEPRNIATTPRKAPNVAAAPNVSLNITSTSNGPHNVRPTPSRPAQNVSATMTRPQNVATTSIPAPRVSTSSESRNRSTPVNEPRDRAKNSSKTYQIKPSTPSTSQIATPTTNIPPNVAADSPRPRPDSTYRPILAKVKLEKE